MKIIVNKIDGDLTGAEHVVLRGLVTGNITVERTGSFDLRSICCKSLLIEQGGETSVHGMIDGDLINRGGEATVFGHNQGFCAR